MFEVACPSCKATYQVDERRVPPTGLKMRCPKCGESFQVAAPGAPAPGAAPPGAPGASGEPVLGAALGLGGKGPGLAGLGVGSPGGAAKGIGKSTVLGVAPKVELPRSPAPAAPAGPKAPLPAPRGLKSTMIGVAPAQADVSPKPPPAATPAAKAPAGPPPRPALTRPAVPVPVKSNLHLDLADEEPIAELGDDELEADLPSARPAARTSASPAAAPAHETEPPAPRRKNLFPSVDALDFSAPEPKLPFDEEDEAEEADLPSPTAALSAELDLDVERSSIPSPDQPTTVRPAKSGPANKVAAAEIDLPSIPPPPDASESDLDLPVPAPAVGLPAHRRAPADHPTTRMPAVSGRSGGGDDIGLPAVVAAGVAHAELPDLLADLPTVGGNLPDLRLGDDLPDLTADLPIVGGELPMRAAGLPMPAAGLPMPGAGLPMPGASLPSPAAGLPDRAAGLPDAAAALPGGLSGLPQPGATPPARHDSGAAHLDDFGARSPADFGSVDFGGADSFDDFGGGAEPSSGASPADDEGEFDAFPTDEGGASSGSRPAREAAGRAEAGYGEVALDGGGGGGIALEEEPERPRADTGPRVVAPEAPGAAAATAPAAAPTAILPQEKRRMSRGAKIAIATTVSLTIAGGALSVLPEVGPYGSYVVMDALKAEEHAARLESLRGEVDKLMAADSVDGADQAFLKAERAQQTAARYRPTRAYAAYVGFMRQVRFGRDAQSFARAKVLLDSFEGEQGEQSPHLTLAGMARDAAEGKLSGIAARAQALLKSSKDLDTAALVGEVALLAGEKELALTAWQRATKVQASPRTSFGLARVHALFGKDAEAQKLAEEVLAKSPGHTGGRLLLARLHLGDRARDAELVKDLEALAEPTSKASQTERVDALNLLGRLHFLRSRVTRAEESFSKALALQSSSVEAMLGLGDALFASGRNAEALARYEAATKLAPEDLGAQLGVVRAKLALESLADAAKILDGLRQKHPKSTAVAYWFGRAKELVGEKELALTSYRGAVEVGEDVPELVAAYVGMTRLLGQLGAGEEAAKQIQTALTKFPDRPEIYVAVGDLATSQAAYERAIAQYDKALSLDPADIGIHFKRGVALRRARNFEGAQKEFDLVAQGDPEFPGLALEWGLFYEASGRSAEALASYEVALKKAPNDLDLMLRVGCGKASAGQPADAEKMLRKVLDERSTSGETNHCLGRAVLLSGDTSRLHEAMRFLERAVVLDANRAEHHLYVGWAANELSDPAKAQQALDRALELDQTLADAYWQRGVLRGRQGAVRDAVTDLERALQLSPSRYEAYASLADAYFNLGREPDALAAWQKAVTLGPAQPVWRFRYGKLLLDNRRAPEARQELEQAIVGAEKLAAKPQWLWEAHRLLALVIGRDPAAIPHWQKFVVNADSNSPYRAEALRALKALGQ